MLETKLFHRLLHPSFPTASFDIFWGVGIYPWYCTLTHNIPKREKNKYAKHQFLKTNPGAVSVTLVTLVMIGSPSEFDVVQPWLKKFQGLDPHTHGRHHSLLAYGSPTKKRTGGVGQLGVPLVWHFFGTKNSTKSSKVERLGCPKGMDEWKFGQIGPTQVVGWWGGTIGFQKGPHFFPVHICFVHEIWMANFLCHCWRSRFPELLWLRHSTTSARYGFDGSLTCYGLNLHSWMWKITFLLIKNRLMFHVQDSGRKHKSTWRC